MNRLRSLPYEAVLFDLDGTLIDSSPSILNCFAAIITEAGLKPIVPLEDSLIGPPLRQTLINLTGSTDSDLLDKMVADFKACYDTEGYKATRVYEGVETLLEHLTTCGIPLAIATNKRRIPTLKILEHLGWSKYVCIVGTLDTPAPPHVNKAALIKSILNEMAVSAESTLYVGDKWEDGVAAEANKVPFCAVEWGYGEWNSTQMPPTWVVINNVRDLLRLYPD